MSKRIIIQSVLFKDGLVVTVEESASAEEISVAVLEAVPQEHRSADLQIFDEADDDLETREFGDCEELRRGHVVHVGHCLVVDVVVRYAGRVADRRFPPATRVGRIRRWAVHKLGISAADANELVLQVAGTNIQPSRDQHVGSFVEAGTCNAVFDLVRSYSINGDATVQLGQGHAALLKHFDQAPFVLGESSGRWRVRNIEWPHVFVDVRARDGREFTLRLQCEGYPQAPTGAFWDVANSSWLAASQWPRTGTRFGAALRTDWQGGTALYVPCDRCSIAGHEVWLQLHPAWAWDPRIGIARYLEVVWTMLNGDDYVAPAA